MPPDAGPKIRSVGRSRAVSCAGAAALGLLLTMLAYYPGYMSQDSISQLTQARSGVFSDWHPPLMGELWRILDGWVAGPGGMLLYHNVLFWSALGILAWLTVPGVVASALAVALIGLLPPVFGLLSTIWKDVGMGTALLFSFAMILLAERRRPGWYLTLAISGLLYATAVRHNSPPAILPLCIWFTSVATRNRIYLRSTIAHWTISLLFFAGVVLGAGGLNRAFTTSGSTYPIQQILLHDLTAVSLATGHYLIPPPPISPADSFGLENLKPLYSTDEIVPLYCCGVGPRRFSLLTSPDDITVLRQRWLESISSNPMAYLRHRFRVFQHLMGLRRGEVCNPYHPSTDANALGVESPHSFFTRLVMRYLVIFRNSFLFRGWLYLVLSLAAVGWLAARRWSGRRLGATPVSEGAAWALASSALLYQVPYFFVATTCDFRMLWWSVLAVLVFPGVAGFFSDPNDAPQDSLSPPASLATFTISC